MRSVYLLFVLLFCGMNGFSQTLNPARSADWKLAGYNGHGTDPANLIDFQTAGGVADGTTPNDVALANVMASLNNDSAIIYFADGIYYFEHPINLAEKIILRGESSDSTLLLFNLLTPDHLIKIQGSASAIESPLINDIFKDSMSVEVSDSGLFVKGDYVKITEFDSLLVTSAWALYSTGQIVRIDSVDNHRLYLHSPLRRNFFVSRNVKVVKLNLAEEAGIENLKIQRVDATTQQTSNIYMNYALNCRVKCVESLYCNFAHINVNNSSNIEISGCYIHEAFSYGDGGKAYGVMLESSTGECMVKENIFDHLRHSMILQAGANGNVFAYNYSMNPYWTDVTLPSNSAGDLVLHGNYPYCNLFEGNTVQHIVIDDSHGINGQYNTFFRNRAELYGLFMNTTTPTNDQNFIGNEITNTGFLLGNYFLSGTGHFQYGNNVRGTITPAGTTNLPEASLFIDTIPSYYQQFSSWPPIGIPNSSNAFHIEAQDRYLAGSDTKCRDTLIITSQPDPASLPAMLLYPNPANDQITLVTGSQSAVTVCEIIVCSSTGAQLLTFYNTSSISLKTLSDGLYFVRVRLSDQQCILKKVIKFSDQ